MIVIKPDDEKTFSEYIFEGLSNYIEIDEKDRVRLQMFMDKIHGEAFTPTEFKEAFGLYNAGPVRIYELIRGEDWLYDVIEFGNQCAARKAQAQVQSK